MTNTTSHNDLVANVAELFPSVRRMLEDLTRIRSVSAEQYPAEEVRRAAVATAALLAKAGMQDVRLLEIEGAHPSVFGEIPAPAGAPTVLLYAHYDVQPPGLTAEWVSEPFEPTERDGRLYGRGVCDDKAGIAVHLGAVMAHGGRPPVGVKILVEGEEEIGSPNLTAFLDAYREQLRADAIVIADSSNLKTGAPSLTTSVRGLVDCTIEVRTLQSGIHSGMFGGPVPDALSALVRLLASLQDGAGNVAVPGLVAYEVDPLDLTEDELRETAGMMEGVELVGSGNLTSRLWTRPAISVLAIDAPPVGEEINQLAASARAVISLRLAPGEDPERARAALERHLVANVPWGARLTIGNWGLGEAFRMNTTGAAYDAYREAFRIAWGRDAADIGIGGSIPIVGDLSERYPDAAILLTGVGDHLSREHGPDESVDLRELQRGILAESIAFRLLANCEGA
ncbi:MAG: M20/M25/M40 family metallo-hydrolase [Gammaproteobacteria bacterium]|nr:M20/M25/M40 family metallo-hydrolase [Gammaproteobacteria bacterium]